MKPRPSGVVRSRYGLSNTLMRAPWALMRSMRWIPSIVDLVARVPFGNHEYMASRGSDRLCAIGELTVPWVVKCSDNARHQ
jgi:hypothetical protein